MKLYKVRVWMVVAGLFASGTAPAETAYVVDKLQIGIHQSDSFDSAIIKLLPTGESLEVLERRDEFVRVRTDDDIDGWVDSGYIMSEKPAQLVVLELEASYAEAIAALGEANVAIAELNDRIAELEIATTNQSNATTVENSMTSDSLREVQRLAEENQRLKDELANAFAVATEAARTIAQMEAVQVEPAQVISKAVRETMGLNSPQVFIQFSQWQWILIGSFCLLSFSVGGYLVDYFGRRRHGGYRV